MGLQSFERREIFSYPKHPDLMWSSPILLFSTCLGFSSSNGQSGQFVGLTSHVRLMLSLRMKGAVPPFLHMSTWRIQG